MGGGMMDSSITDQQYHGGNHVAGGPRPGLDYTTLERLRREHPAWRLLCSEHAPLVASFLHRVFIAPNSGC